MRGIPTRLYMDNAKIYRSPQLARIAASRLIRNFPREHPFPRPHFPPIAACSAKAAGVDENLDRGQKDARKFNEKARRGFW